MSHLNAQAALKQYQQVGVQAVTGASPHMLIQMLLEGALERIAGAKGHMLRNDPAKGGFISRAIGILDGLRESLNLEVGGDIAENLNQLYEYCQRRLLQANVANDAAILDEVASLLREIKTAWDAIECAK